MHIHTHTHKHVLAYVQFELSLFSVETETKLLQSYPFQNQSQFCPFLLSIPSPPISFSISSPFCSPLFCFSSIMHLSLFRMLLYIITITFIVVVVIIIIITPSYRSLYSFYFSHNYHCHHNLHFIIIAIITINQELSPWHFHLLIKKGFPAT